MIIRTATPSDAAQIAEIYRPYVETTAITFEYDPPDADEIRQRMQHTLEKYPYLVAEEGSEILGYAYTGSFVGRAAYDWSAETSIYLKQDARGHGLGRILYEKIEEISRAQHIINLNACIAAPEEPDEYLDFNSVQFHGHLGYEPVGTFHRCGYKFGRWYHMIWMEKMLSEHPEVPEAMVPFSKL